MSENVTPEEVDALVGEEESMASSEAIELRDFSQPKRLSPAQQQAIRASIQSVVPAIEAKFGSWVRQDVTIQLAGIGESSAIGLFDGMEDPIAIQSLDVEGARGWIVWENKAALLAVLATLGSEAPENFEARDLSPIEAGLAGDILSVFSTQVCALFELDATPLGFSQNLREFMGQSGSPGNGDTQRLFLHFDIERDGSSSTVRLYLPKILPKSEDDNLEPSTALPNHLDHVPVQLSAVLGCADVSLADLMKIEPGDVIPLDSTVGTPIDILIEGDRAGTAQWGNHNGCLALSIVSLDSSANQTTPTEQAPTHE